MKKAVSVLLLAVLLLGVSVAGAEESFPNCVTGKWWTIYARPQLQLGIQSVFIGADGSMTCVRYYSKEMYSAENSSGQWTQLNENTLIMAVGGSLVYAYYVDGALYFGDKDSAQRYTPGVPYNPDTDLYIVPGR